MAFTPLSWPMARLTTLYVSLQLVATWFVLMSAIARNRLLRTHGSLFAYTPWGYISELQWQGKDHRPKDVPHVKGP